MMKSAYVELYDAAVALVAVLDKTAEQLLPQEIVDVVKLHSKLAVGSALIPVPGADVAAGAANIWTMYGRVNSKVGISIKDNVLKTIGSGVVTNLASYMAMAGLGSAIKAIPGIGTLTGTALMSASLYAVTLASGYIYVKALTLLANKGNGSIDITQIDSAVKEILGNKEVIKNFIKAAKSDFKNNESEIANK
jgi:uncharacterized protein (DUF697 family)